MEQSLALSFVEHVALRPRLPAPVSHLERSLCLDRSSHPNTKQQTHVLCKVSCCTNSQHARTSMPPSVLTVVVSFWSVDLGVLGLLFWSLEWLLFSLLLKHRAKVLLLGRTGVHSTQEPGACPHLIPRASPVPALADQIFP